MGLVPSKPENAAANSLNAHVNAATNAPKTNNAAPAANAVAPIRPEGTLGGRRRKTRRAHKVRKH